MRLLLSNDDGIGSPFLPAFAAALSEVAEVEIVVPAREQSWIGRAYTRHAAVAPWGRRKPEALNAALWRARRPTASI